MKFVAKTLVLALVVALSACSSFGSCGKKDGENADEMKALIVPPDLISAQQAKPAADDAAKKK